MEEKTTTPLLSSRSYDILKFLALVFLPALGTLYFGLSQIWGLPAGEEVVGTIVLLDAFLGALLKISDRSYATSGARYDGTMNVVEDPEGNKTVSLEVDEDPYDLDQKKEAVFKIQKADLPPQ